MPSRHRGARFGNRRRRVCDFSRTVTNRNRVTTTVHLKWGDIFNATVSAAKRSTPSPAVEGWRFFAATMYPKCPDVWRYEIVFSRTTLCTSRYRNQYAVSGGRGADSRLRYACVYGFRPAVRADTVNRVYARAREFSGGSRTVTMAPSRRGPLLAAVLLTTTTMACAAQQASTKPK